MYLILDEFGIATGAEREELEWKQQVESLLICRIDFGILCAILDPCWSFENFSIFCRAKCGLILLPLVGLLAQRLVLCLLKYLL